MSLTKSLERYNTLHENTFKLTPQKTLIIDDTPVLVPDKNERYVPINSILYLVSNFKIRKKK
jgi:hypothetical protein